MIHGRKEELRKVKRRAPLAAEAEQFKGALGALRETLWVQIGPYSKVEHSEASGSEPWPWRSSHPGLPEQVEPTSPKAQR